MWLQLQLQRRYGGLQGGAKKSSPLSVFAIFSATTQHFFIILYVCILHSYLHLPAKYNRIIFKTDEVTSLLARQLIHFYTVKNVHNINLNLLENDEYRLNAHDVIMTSF